MKALKLIPAISFIAVIMLLSCDKSDRNMGTAEEKVESNYSKNTFSSDNITINDPALNEKIKQSVIRTFGKSIEAKVTSVGVQKIPDGNIYTYEYTTTEDQKSSFVVIDNVILKSKVTVDCYGTCECREKVILNPDTGNPVSYECTCDKCKMSVTVE